MKNFAYNRVLIFFIVIGFFAAMAINFERHNVETQNTQIDLAIDYEGLLELAEREGLPPEKVLADAKDAGITSLAVYETTFRKLNENGKVSAKPGSAILAAYHGGTLNDENWASLVKSGRIVGTEVYVTGHDAGTFTEVKEDLIRRLGEDRVSSLSVGGEEVLAVKAQFFSLQKMNLGMPTDEMRAVNKAGFYVLARPSNYEHCSPDDVKAVFSRLDGIDVSEIVFSGTESLGATKSLRTTIDAMKERDITLGLIEATNQLQFYKQEGMSEIAKGLGYDRVARLYSIPKDEQPKLKMSVAVERWANTDHERNIRINLLRIYDKPSPDMSLYETNMKYFRDTRDILTAKGYTLGKAGTFQNYYPNRILRALVVTGAAAAGILYLSLVIPKLNKRSRLQYILFALCAAVAAAPLLLGSDGNKVRLVAAFAAANIFPALAVIALLDRLQKNSSTEKISLPKIIFSAAVALAVTSALSFVGAAYLSGALSDTEYFLEFNIYRGIKLTFVLPLILVAAAFLQRFDIFDGKMDDTPGAFNQLKKILDMPVKIKTLLGIFVAVAALVVFIARSGHTSGMPVSDLELRFRAFLEQAFYARPRSKELLIGHPAFMLGILAFWRKWPTMVLFGLVVVATIGQGSMVETFAHMRTPVYMSLMRGFGGIVLGAGLGAVLMTAAELWHRFMNKFFKETLHK